MAKPEENKKADKIMAIDAADLCYKRVDGTRIYIKNVLDRIGKYDKKNSFYIYLKGQINKDLLFKKFSNYFLKCSKSLFFWTQLKFPFELKRDKPDILWMPLQTVPFFVSKKMKMVITVHDLAFKIFPKSFTLKDRILLRFFTWFSVNKADKIIAVSENTRKDVIKYYQISPNKIKVVYHGYDKQLYNLENARDNEKIAQVKAKFSIKGSYIIYIGALQPRKNLKLLIKAFEKVKEYYSLNGMSELRNIKLVIAGPKAWLFKPILKQVEKSKFKDSIIFTGHFETRDLPALLGGSKLFVFPTLYEGFGIPLLEAMACGVPVIASKNSSLIEVGSYAVMYFKNNNYISLKQKIIDVLSNDNLKNDMIDRGLERVKSFSWDKCAKNTLKVLKDW